jgi:hypothetical protein
MILSPQDGALAKILLPAKLCGGHLGSGHQWWSWISIDDAIGAIHHALTTPTLSGPVNFVTPDPVRQHEFANQLGQVLRRPAIFPAPAFALRLALGEMADALLLSSTRVYPAQLTASHYRFLFADLREYLQSALGREDDHSR